MKKILLLFLFCISLTAFTNTEDSIRIAYLDEVSAINADSIRILSNKIIDLELTIEQLSQIQQSNMQIVDFAVSRADSRVGWAVGILGMIFTLIIFGAGILTYLNTVKEAREILKNFDSKVEEKFIERERKEILKRIDLVFTYIKENNFDVDDRCRIISDNLPFPLEEIYRKEILSQLIFLNLKPHQIHEIYDEFSQFFFKCKDDTNDKLAEFIINLDPELMMSDVKDYFVEYHNDSKFLVRVLLPKLLDSPISIWGHWTLFVEQFDDLFKHIEKENLALSQFKKYVNHMMKINIGMAGGGTRPSTKRDAIMNINNTISHISETNKKSYGFIRFKELFDTQLDNILPDVDGNDGD